MIRVGVVGAAGYAGSELVRLLLGHPSVEVVAVTSTSRAGIPLGEAVPGLAGFTSLVLEDFEPERLSDLDAVLLATPHGAASRLVESLDACPCVLDLSSDHRHAPGWVYGMVELVEELHLAPRVAVPGCFATAMNLALGPLVRAGVVDGPVEVAALTGSTGSGASPRSGTHHPERFANVRAYKVLEHQHVPEVRAFLGRMGHAPELRFVPISAPLDRGIFATVFAPVAPEVPALEILADAYAHRPLVRFRSESPELRLVRGTGLADLAVRQDARGAVILVALDNLGKGAAAQAVQCLNLTQGLPADTGLFLPPATP